MNFPFFIAKRYLFSKSSSNAVNIITGVSVFGVSIGAFALILVLSVFSGLENMTIQMLNTFDPELKITPAQGKTFELSEQQITSLRKINGVAHASTTLEEKVFVTYKDREYIAWLKGIDQEYLSVNRMDTTVYRGRWFNPDETDKVVAGHWVAHHLSMPLRDFYQPLKIHAPNSAKVAASRPDKAFKTVNSEMVGIFAFDKEHDEKYIIAPISLPRQLLGKANAISAIEIALLPGHKAEEVKTNLETFLGSAFEVKTRRQQHELVYKMMNTENVATYLIFTLILIIALFNVTGSIVMLILDKKDNLKTLWALGASEKELKKVFVLEGMLITFFGGMIGLALGIVLVLLQEQFGLIRLGGEFSSPYPVELTIGNVMAVIVTISILGYFASKISVGRLSRKVVQQ